MIKLGLLGNNISKSEMPNFMTKLGNEFDFEIKYELFDKALEKKFNFKNFLSQIKEKNIFGLNVTYPFKELAVEHSTELSEETKLVKSTNLLLINESITSHNTDYIGFLNTYKFNFNQRPSKLVVLGGGGVGKSVCFALIKLGVKELYIIEKDHIKLEKLISTNTGLNPFITTELISDTQVKVGTIISFFFGFLLIIFKAEIVIKFADDPELTNTEYFVPNQLDHFFSNSFTFFDCVKVIFLRFINFFT